MSSDRTIRFLRAGRHVAPARRRVTTRMMGTKLGVHAGFAPPRSFVLPLHHTVDRKGVSLRALSRHMNRVLHIGFVLKLFSGPCPNSSHRPRAMMRGTTRRRMSVGTTLRSVILLGGRGRVLPLSGDLGGVTIVNPGTRRIGRLAYECNPTRTPVGAMCRKVGRCLPGTRIDCTGKYGVVSGCFPRDRLCGIPLSARRRTVVGRTMRLTGISSVTVLMLNKGRGAIQRRFSHADLSLYKHRRRLLRTMCTAKGPMILMVMSKETTAVG